MTRVQPVKKVKMAHHRTTTAKLKPPAARTKGLPKRVQHGGRMIMSREEWEECIDLYVKTKSYPSSKEKHVLASKLDRCPKQMSIWFGNRRQDFVKAERKGMTFPTEATVRNFLWTKWRVQEQEGSDTTFDSSLTDATSEVTRASSAELSDYSVSEAVTPTFEVDPKPQPVDPLLMLLEAARLIDAEDKRACDVEMTLLGLQCA